MKKLVLLLLLFTFPVSAISINSDFVNGIISPDQYALVTCEREKRLGSVNAFRDRVCCINNDLNQYCGNDESMLGSCDGNLCVWPTPTFKPGYSARYRRAPCAGFAILAGDEYSAFLTAAECNKNGEYWCCSPFAFPPLERTVMPKTSVKPWESSVTGSLLILNSAKWRALELGQLKHLKFEQQAFAFEKNRCAAGGGDIKIIDRKYGSFFMDSKNLKPGMRVFYFSEGKVTPLVAYC